MSLLPILFLIRHSLKIYIVSFPISVSLSHTFSLGNMCKVSFLRIWISFSSSALVVGSHENLQAFFSCLALFRSLKFFGWGFLDVQGLFSIVHLLYEFVTCFWLFCKNGLFSLKLTDIVTRSTFYVHLLL